MRNDYLSRMRAALDSARVEMERGGSLRRTAIKRPGRAPAPAGVRPLWVVYHAAIACLVAALIAAVIHFGAMASRMREDLARLKVSSARVRGQRIREVTDLRAQLAALQQEVERNGKHASPAKRRERAKKRFLGLF